MSSGIIAAVAAVAAAGMGMASANKASKDAKSLAESSKPKAVDITSEEERARIAARRNLFDSMSLEREATPEIARLRELTSQQLLQDAIGNANDKTSGAVQQKVLDALNSTSELPALERSALFDAATNRALADLQLGGNLDTATRNEVTRRALGTSADVSGGLGLGRDISARDLGLTSMGLQQQRLQAAMAQGGADLNLNLGQQGAKVNQAQLNMTNMADNAQLYNSLNQQQQNRNLTLAQYIQSIQQPVAGLDPSSLVNLSVGNTSTANNAAQQQAAIAAQASANKQLAVGQALGAGIGGLAQIDRSKAPKPTAPKPTAPQTTAPYTGMGSTVAQPKYASTVPFLQQQNYGVAPVYGAANKYTG